MFVFAAAVCALMPCEAINKTNINLTMYLLIPLELCACTRKTPRQLTKPGHFHPLKIGLNPDRLTKWRRYAGQRTFNKPAARQLVALNFATIAVMSSCCS